MPRVLADLYPEKVFYYFEQISAIPRGSGNVKKIADYLCFFANAVRNSKHNITVYLNIYNIDVATNKLYRYISIRCKKFKW